MKKLLLLSHAIGMFFIITAYKEKHGQAQPVYLLSMETHTRTEPELIDTTLYKYDMKNRITEIIHLQSAYRQLGNSDQKLSYDANDRLVSVDENIAANAFGVSHHNQTKFTYTDDYVAKHSSERTVFPRLATDKVTDDTLILDDRRQVVKHIYGFNLNGKRADFYDILKYDASGNVVSLANYHAPDNVLAKDTVAYVYDDSKSPFVNVKGNFYLFLQLPNLMNNYTSVHTIYRDGKYTVDNKSVIGMDITSKFAYRFNADGYPVMATDTATIFNIKPQHVYKPRTTIYTFSYIVR